MTDVVMISRPKPTLTTPTNDLYDWETVTKKLGERNIFNFLQIAFSPWLTVCAPEGVECALKNAYGQGLYQYKEYEGMTYCLEMQVR